MTTGSDRVEQYLRDELGSIIRLMGESRVREIDVEEEEVSLRIVRQARVEGGPDSEALIEERVEAALPGASMSLGLKRVSAPMVGVFFHSEQPGGAPLVSEGARVERGAMIGVIEALGVLTEVESEISGVVQRLLAADGQAVEFGQPLVEILSDA